jgi:hypothetical protein
VVTEKGPIIFRRLVVVLDRPEAAEFLAAKDWASRLRLPLVASALREGSLEPCALSGDLVVFGQGLPLTTKRQLLRQTQGIDGLGVLVCGETRAVSRRILVVPPATVRIRPMLTNVAPLCRGLAAELVVLTVARSERAAQQDRAEIEAALDACGLSAEVDSIVGVDAREAVVHIARWRRCQLVVVERSQDVPWWRRLGRSRGEDALQLGGGFSLLMLPPKVILDNVPAVPAIDTKPPSVSAYVITGRDTSARVGR